VPGKVNQFLTASADKTIILWQENAATMVFSGHKDVVRCLLPLNDEIFLSAGNDSTLRLWNIQTGKCEKIIESTTGEFIYRLAFTKLAQFISLF
jgi:phospholipase A-2-activating protein